MGISKMKKESFSCRFESFDNHVHFDRLKVLLAYLVFEIELIYLIIMYEQLIVVVIIIIVILIEVIILRITV